MCERRTYKLPIFFLSLCIGIYSLHMQAECGSKIKLYSFFTPSHQVLKDDWFLPSIKDDFEVIIHQYPQDCPSGKYMSDGWKVTMTRKVDLIINAIRENWGEIFIYSDIDVQFFKPIKREILCYMHDKDIIFQRDTPSGTVCAGFIACRANEYTLDLFNAVKEYMYTHNLSDQKSLNYVLRKAKQPFPIRWGYLPSKFFGAGTLLARNWSPGKLLTIPKNIVLHHANWTEGVNKKISQLRYVRMLVRLRMRYKKVPQSYHTSERIVLLKKYLNTYFSKRTGITKKS